MARPKLSPIHKKTPRSIKLPEWVWLAVDQQASKNCQSRAVIIEEALRMYFRKHKIILRLPDPHQVDIED